METSWPLLLYKVYKIWLGNLILMNGKLWEREFDALLVELFVNTLVHIEIYCPVVG